MPHFTGKPPESMKITGFLLLWYEDTNQPVLLRSHPSDNNPHVMLPIFSTHDKLYDAVRAWLKPDGPWKIKKIDDGIDFLNSIGGKVLVAADPHIVNGNTRFTAVFRDTEFN
jgi:hypothetical protein